MPNKTSKTEEVLNKPIRKLSDKEIRDRVVSQALREIQWARVYKQGKIRNWQINEQMYYTKVNKSSYATGLNYGNISAANSLLATSRSNVNLARMQEFVHTLQSKTNTPLVFKYQKKKESQLARVKRLNSLVTQDRDTGFWDIKRLVGQKQVIIYGRAQFCYYADSVDGYQSHLENIDVYDFLIDPSGGGLDYEKARYMGRYGVVFDKDDLEAGVAAGIYDKDSVREIIQGGGNNTESPQEETNKLSRMYGQNTIGKKELTSDNKFKFWEWYTTFFNPNTQKTERYCLTMQERAGKAIEVSPLTDKFGATKDLPLGPWPIWGYAAFPDLTEYWTPSYCDYARENIMAQDVTINQMLDNSEAINKPMKLVQVGAIENLAELKYRRDGRIMVKQGVDINKAFQTLVTPAIDSPIKVFNILDRLLQKSMGVSDQAEGIHTDTSTDTLGIYEGNKEEADDRFELLNTSESFGMNRFAKLYELGVRENLTKKIAVDMIGGEGIEQEMVSKNDMFKKSDSYGVIVEASDAEERHSESTKDRILKWLEAETDNQITWPILSKLVNIKKIFEYKAGLAGVKDEDIREFLDNSVYGDNNLMSECAKDIEELEQGNDITPNPSANTAYLQKLNDYIQSHLETIQKDPALLKRFALYVQGVVPIATKNTAREVQQHATNLLLETANAPLNGANPPQGGIPPVQPGQPMPQGAPPMQQPANLPINQPQ